MPDLKVPEKDEKPLSTLAALPKGKLRAIVEALAEASPTLLWKDLAQNVAAKAQIDSTDAHELIRLLATMQAVRIRSGQSVSEFVEDVSVAAENMKTADLRLTPERRGLFKQVMTELLGCNALYVTSKALDVLLENQHVWCEGRIVTDLRPVFAENDEPAAFVITHLVRIRYHEGVGHHRKDFFVSMTGHELDELIGLLQRAQRKEQSLRRKAPLPVLDVALE